MGYSPNLRRIYQIIIIIAIFHRSQSPTVPRMMIVNDLHQQFTFLQIFLLTAPLPSKQQGSTNLIIPSNEMGSMIVMRSSLRLLFIKEVHL